MLKQSDTKCHSECKRGISLGIASLRLAMTSSVILILVLFSIGTSQTERWGYRYNGPGNGSDSVRAIVYGADGNLYTAGTSYGIGTSDDFTVISLTSTGAQRWVYRYNGPGNDGDYAYSLVYGADGNIYTAGTSYGIGTSDDFTVISLSSAGSQRWVYQYNGPGNNYDEAYSLVYGADGNIYAAGYSGTDFTVISLTSTGNERWVYRYNGPGNSSDWAYSLVYGADGNIYVAGMSTGSGTDYDFTVISLSSTGTQRWVYQYNGPGNSNDEAYSLVYGADGNIYIAGYSTGSGTYWDFTVISLTTGGYQRWIYRYDSFEHHIDRALSIIYGGDGNLYSAGYKYANDFTIISLTTDGNERWIYYGGLSYGLSACSIIYGADGNIYSTGTRWASGVNFDLVIMSLSPGGIQRWIYSYNGPGNGFDAANSIVYGADGNIYAGGYSFGSGTGIDFTVISLNPAIGIEEQTANRVPLTAFRCFGNKIELSFTLSKPTNIPISVYNTVGEKVLAFDISASVGTSHHQKDLSFLPTGVYIVKADIENRSITKKFVVVK